jgi:hypothetical protein
MDDEASWLHVDLNRNGSILGYMKVKPAEESDLPLDTLGLLLASCAKLVSETLQRIRSEQTVEHLSQDLCVANESLDREKGRAENERNQKESILNGIPLGLMFLDEEGRIGFANREAKRLLAGHMPLTGRRTQDLIKDPMLEKGIKVTRQGTQTVSQESHFAGPNQSAGTSVRWFLAPLPGGAGSMSPILLVLEDLSPVNEREKPQIPSEGMETIMGLAGGSASNLHR